MALTMVLGEFEYRISLIFNKTNSEEIYVSKEKFEFKKAGNKKLVFKKLAEIQNTEDDLVPKFYLGKDSNTDYFKTINDKIILKKGFSQKDLILKFNNLNSMLSQIYTLTKDSKADIIVDSMIEFINHWENVYFALNMMMVITLKEQAMYNLGILIPLKIHNDDVHGTIILQYNEDKNIYDQSIADELIDVLNDIKPFLSTLVPDSELIVETEIVSVGEKNRIAIKLYIEKDGLKIPLERESTGTIKLFSILSALIYYVKDEHAIVLIDELDIHIFEYLLSIILDILSESARGQLIFTGHNLLPLERLSKDAIIISSKTSADVSYEYLKGSSSTTNLRSKYLKSQSMYSEENIEPLMVNQSALKLFVRELVID